MVTNCCAVGATSRLAIGLASGTPTRMDFTHFYGERVVKTLSDGSSQTIRGVLDPVSTNVAEGMLHVQFRVRMWMSAAKNEILLPCMGFTNVSTLWTLVDLLPPCTVIVGPSGAPEVTYNNCVVTDWVCSGQKGANPIQLDIGFIGKTRVPNPAGTFFVSQTSPSMLEGYTYPYPDGTYSVTRFNVLGADRYFPLFRISNDNGVISEFNQSVSATNLCPTTHNLTFQSNTLYSVCDSSTDLLSVPMSGDVSGGPLTVDLERTVEATTYETIFMVANAKLIARDTSIEKNAYNRLPIQAKGYALPDGTPMLRVTNIAS